MNKIYGYARCSTNEDNFNLFIHFLFPFFTSKSFSVS